MAENIDHRVDSESREEARAFVTTGDRESAMAESLSLILNFSQIDGAHHKAWILDQVTRKLTGPNYQAFVDHHDLGEVEGLDLKDPDALATARKIAEGDYYDGDFTDEEIERIEDSYYSWDEGIAP